jgi:hypothetical protein
MTTSDCQASTTKLPNEETLESKEEWNMDDTA